MAQDTTRSDQRVERSDETMNEGKAKTDAKHPWHDTPNHLVAGEICGPIVIADESDGSARVYYRCGACGAGIANLSDGDKARVAKAHAAWDAEVDWEIAESAARRENDRKAPLLADAIARRRARMKGTA